MFAAVNRNHHSILFAALALAILIAASCATPVQPTGGERDRSGPQIVHTYPENETVLFDGNRIVFEFDKFVDRRSFEEAFRVEPELGLDYSISWRRKVARITFDGQFPDTTTIIFTLGTELRDSNNNRVEQPLRLAISTGPEIDEGRITAKVLNAETGAMDESGRVLLYRQPINLDRPANYIGEPDTGGVVHFEYLREGTYKAFWLDDRNRNNMWDRERERAFPFYKEKVALEKASSADFGTIYISDPDTVSPVLQAVGLHTTDRLRLRFSEPIVFSDSTEITILQEDSTHFADVIPLFTERGNRNVLFGASEQPTADETDYRIRIRNIFDPSGNEAISNVVTFPGSADEDTVLNRFISHEPPGQMLSDEPVIIRYAKRITEPEITDSLIVIEGSSEHIDWPHTEIRNNLLLIHPDESWRDGTAYEFRVWNPGIMDRRNIRPEILSENELGAVEILIGDDLPEGPYRYRLLRGQNEIIRSGVFTDSTTLTLLPPENYRLILFHDRKENGLWDSGSVDPYQEPAFYDVISPVPVQRGLTGTVRIGEEQDSELEFDEELPEDFPDEELEPEPDQEE